MNKIKARLRRCADTTTATGTLKMLFKVGSDGRVTSVEIQQSPDPAIEQCAITVGKTLLLPRSQNGLTFSYPIVIN